MKTTKIGEIYWANNSHKSSVRALKEAGTTTGKYVYNLKHDERRLAALLWEHREAIAAWAKAQEGGEKKW